MKIGFIGLGKMGSLMVRKLITGGHEVSIWNRSPGSVEQLINSLEKIENVSGRLMKNQSLQALAASLGSPRIIWSMLPAGEVTESALSEVSHYLQKGDILIDGGNAYYKDSQKRYEEYKKKQIRFLGVGVSGGMFGQKDGYALMAGGDKYAFEVIRPILETLSTPRADFTYLGEGGAGHFVKMVHNAIEYGMMQSLGEGFGILEKSPYSLNLLQAAKIFQKGTIISGFLLDRTVDALSNDDRLSSILGIIAETGEAKWAIQSARDESVTCEIIEKSLEFRKKSTKNKKIQQSFAAKLIAALRHEFGGHTVQKKN